MAPHLTEEELDFIHCQSAAGKSPIEVHKLIMAKRHRRGVDAPDITNVRKAIKGKTYKRARKETRGRKIKLSKTAATKLNTVRKHMLKKTKNRREVRWVDIQKKARTPKAHRSTVKRSFQRYGIKVAARRPREKPRRTKEQEEERAEYCREWSQKPADFYLKRIDLIIDNKVFDLPTSAKARERLAEQRVRFHLRTPSEGLNSECTKPSNKKHKFNMGGKVNVCAGISNGRIVLWEYLPKTWNGETASKLYGGPIIKTLEKQRGKKRQYTLLEDNDPRGYKSEVAMATKRKVGIHTLPFPCYSPDLNPLDFAIWDAVLARMVKNAPKKVETVEGYKKRLRLTALRLPGKLIADAVRSMPDRMRAVAAANGGHIKRD